MDVNKLWDDIFDETWWNSPTYEEEINMVLTYVPDAEYYTFQEAFDLAYYRDEETAELLLNDLVDGGVL